MSAGASSRILAPSGAPGYRELEKRARVLKRFGVDIAVAEYRGSHRDEAGDGPREGRSARDDTDGTSGQRSGDVSVATPHGDRHHARADEPIRPASRG